MLAMPWALKFLRRNFELGKLDYPQTLGLLELVPFDYYWIGNWGGGYAEDYNPACPIDRTEHHKWVIRILSYIHGHGKALEMEHCSEWCVPYLDHCKMVQPQIAKPNEDATGGVQGVPRITLPIPAELEASTLDRLRIQTRLNEVIGFDELVSHAYLDSDRSRERCEYASGVVVEADRGSQTYRVQGHPQFDGQTRPVPGTNPGRSAGNS